MPGKLHWWGTREQATEEYGQDFIDLFDEGNEELNALCGKYFPNTDFMESGSITFEREKVTCKTCLRCMRRR